MSKVYVDVGISLDGFIAGPHGGASNPLGDGGTQIHEWLFRQKSFLQQLELGQDGETGVDNDMVVEMMKRAGANIMGNRMFEEGEFNLPENAPFHSSVFVLTHQMRSPWERKGGTTFYFVNDGIESALEKARDAAGDKDIRISGGASVIQQYLNSGVVDELNLHIAPLMLQRGVRLLEKIEKEKFSLEIKEVINSTRVTHLRYVVKNK